MVFTNFCTREGRVLKACTREGSCTREGMDFGSKCVLMKVGVSWPRPSRGVHFPGE